MGWKLYNMISNRTKFVFFLTWPAWMWIAIVMAIFDRKKFKGIWGALEKISELEKKCPQNTTE